MCICSLVPRPKTTVGMGVRLVHTKIVRLPVSLGVSTLTAKPPNWIPCQFFRLYGMQSLFPTSFYTTSTKKCRNGTLYIYLQFYIIPTLFAYFLTCHHYISNVFFFIFLCRILEYSFTLSHNDHVHVLCNIREVHIMSAKFWAQECSVQITSQVERNYTPVERKKI